MKKILFVYTDNFSTYDIAWAFIEQDYPMDFFDKRFISYSDISQQDIADELSRKLEQDDYWFVLSYNFIPEISFVCEQKKLPYVSQTYDSLTLPLHTRQIQSPYNFTHIFDYDEYCIVQRRFHPKHLYYTPLAANISRIGGTIITDDDIARFSADISFVGNLYDTDEFKKLEQHHSLPKPVEDHFYYLFDYYTGKWGTDTIYNCLDDKTCEILNAVMPNGYKNKYKISDSYYYAFALLGRRIANRDRMILLERLAREFDFSYYGSTKKLPFPIRQHGPIDYWTEFTKIAYLSKINLHLTIPRIANGVSQRCFDIMASGGFLMANYRDAMTKLFEPDVDFVMYTDIEELVDKAHYYLAHDAKREQIARHGCETVIKNHTCAHRAQEIIMELTEAGFTP